MAKNASIGMIEGGLNTFVTSTRITVLAAEPATIAAITAGALATQTIAGAIAKAAGDVSGRKATVPQQTAVPITATGTANHIAIDNGTEFFVTTCTAQGLTAGGTVTIPTWKWEIGAPT